MCAAEPLAWACAGMGKKIGEMLEEYRKTMDITELRNELTEIYASESHDEVARFDDDSLVKLTESQLVHFAENGKQSDSSVFPVRGSPFHILIGHGYDFGVRMNLFLFQSLRIAGSVFLLMMLECYQCRRLVRHRIAYNFIPVSGMPFEFVQLGFIQIRTAITQILA